MIGLKGAATRVVANVVESDCSRITPLHIASGFAGRTDYLRNLPFVHASVPRPRPAGDHRATLRACTASPMSRGSGEVNAAPTGTRSATDQTNSRGVLFLPSRGSEQRLGSRAKVIEQFQLPISSPGWRNRWAQRAQNPPRFTPS